MTTAGELLDQLERHPQSTAAELAERTGASAGRVGHLLDRLERDQRVTRAHVPGRGTCWTSTAPRRQIEPADPLEDLDRFMRTNRSTL